MRALRGRHLRAFWKWKGGQCGKGAAWERGLGKPAGPWELWREAGLGMDFLLSAG